MRFAAALLTVLLLACSCETPSRSGETFEQSRDLMVKTQIQARGIESERVLDAMRAVPREKFIPGEYRQYAYTDSPVPIGFGQTISQPYMVALMTEQLNLSTADKVLEVGTGSGYQAAVLAEIAREVYTVEIVEPLAARARDLLKELGFDNVHVRAGDGYEGWPQHAPYDRIIVTCAPTEIPQPLIEQLAEGGIMVIPVGTVGFQRLYRVKKNMGHIETEEVIPVSFVPLTGPHGE
jgi:protein-L-isoaspartate(D-aspartate) O-methyltransferase